MCKLALVLVRWLWHSHVLCSCVTISTHVMSCYVGRVLSESQMHCFSCATLASCHDRCWRVTQQTSDDQNALRRTTRLLGLRYTTLPLHRQISITTPGQMGHAIVNSFQTTLTQKSYIILLCNETRRNTISNVIFRCFKFRCRWLGNSSYSTPAATMKSCCDNWARGRRH